MTVSPSQKNRKIPQYVMGHPLYKKIRKNSAVWKFEHLENSVLGGIHIFEIIVLLIFVAITAMTSAIFVSVMQTSSKAIATAPAASGGEIG